jgi:hypothetical protein
MISQDFDIDAMVFFLDPGVVHNSLQVHHCHCVGEALGNFLFELDLYGSSIAK